MSVGIVGLVSHRVANTFLYKHTLDECDDEEPSREIVIGGEVFRWRNVLRENVVKGNKKFCGKQEYLEITYENKLKQETGLHSDVDFYGPFIIIIHIFIIIKKAVKICLCISSVFLR
mgnify:CR=1 FL=1